MLFFADTGNNTKKMKYSDKMIKKEDTDREGENWHVIEEVTNLQKKNNLCGGFFLSC